VVEGLVAGVDVLLHDGQFRDEEHRTARAYGHSTVQDALRLADRADVGRLVLTHHAPDRTDAELDALAAAVTATPQGRPVSFARQDEVIESRPRTGVG
jgi:ribonuclease BN (tRNA processing enzyme)